MGRRRKEIMGEVMRFRQAVAQHLGKVLTPEVAAAIELEALYQRDESIDIAQFEPLEYRGVVFAAERFKAIRDELHVLHLAHWQETERYRIGSAMNPDYEYMEWAELAGKLLQFTARMDGVLVGNLRVYLYRDLHTQQKGANEDTLFLLPQVRIGFTANRFVDYAERCLARLDVVDAYVDTKILFDSEGRTVRDVGSLMRRRGYAHVANRYHKRLSKE
jgi:hypothetical protein